MFLFAEAVQIRRVTDLGFDFLLAIAVVIVGDDGHDHAAFVAAGQLESLAVVVEFPLVLPARAIAALALAWPGPSAADRQPSVVIFVRWGARMTQPVWPVQCSTSSPASFSGRPGSPPLPKMVSTKSRLLTRLPGAKNRISIVFPAVKPGTSGQTMGRISSETKHSAGRGLRGGERKAQQRCAAG